MIYKFNHKIIIIMSTKVLIEAIVNFFKRIGAFFAKIYHGVVDYFKKHNQ